ncbi:MAG: amidohydrolase [Alphaproteobacteria bacterium]|nr:MAG: amidohydrolase [Alphaproteobacteria bacterium]
MPVINRIAEFHPEITAWRRHLHQHPELLFETVQTAAFVAERLRAFGCDEVVTGVARNGVVGVIRGRRADSGKVIGLRADMDALPIQEQRDLPWKSTVPGVMHACGHDGHTAILLGAARYLAETRNFDGTVVLLFQPAEEGGGGGKVMVEEGVLDRWGVQEVYGLHNWPGAPEGSILTRPGPLMAGADTFDITLTGKGAHAARPHVGADPLLAAAQLVVALQQIAARNVDPLDSVVVSVTRFQAGTAYNVIPQDARLAGTVRTLKAETRALAERRLGEIAAGIAAAHGCSADVAWHPGYPVTVNHPDQTAFGARVAAEIVGAERVRTDVEPVMGAEDFSYMLQARPGAYVFLGQGDTAGVHHPEYDFNDAVIPVGASWFVRLVETAMPAG